MSNILTMAASKYQMSGEGACDSATTSGLPIRKIARRKIHCILPSSPWLADSRTNIPLGVLYIAGLLREQGHDVVVTSMLDKRYEGNIHLPDAVMDADVHMFGFCTPQFGEALELAAYIKDRNPDALLVAGGPHPSYEPKEVKEAGRQDTYHVKGVLRQRRDYRAADGRHLFDTVIVMEGEVATLQMLSDWDAGHLQPYYYGDKADAMDLDAIPFPAWDLLPQDHIYNDGVAVMKRKYFPNTAYPDASSAVMSLIGTRGCFAAGTSILMADWTERPIEAIRAGDIVAGFDSDTGAFLAAPVLQARIREADDLYRVETENGATLEVTGEHPFITNRGWQTVERLRIGDTLRQVSQDICLRVPDVTTGQMPSLLGGDSSSQDGSAKQSQNAAVELLRRVWTRCASRITRSIEWSGAGRPSEDVLAAVCVGSRQDVEAWRSQSGQTPRGCRTYLRDRLEASRDNIARAETSLGRGTHAAAGIGRLGKWWRDIVRGMANCAWPTGSSDRARNILGWPMCLWASSLPRLYSFQYATAEGGAVQWSPLASSARDRRAVAGLHIGRLECPECLGRVLDTTPTPNSAPDLGARISGAWDRVASITFLGRARVYPITVVGGLFVANSYVNHNCPYKCTYCSTPWIGQKPRYRSPHNIIAEMAQVMDKGVRMFKFQDDTYTLHKTKLRELATAVHSAFGADSFAARIHTRVNTMDDHVAESLKLMNCKVTCFGIESGSQRVLDANWKGTKVQQNTDALITAKRHGFYTIAFLVAGLAGETLETARETMAWLNTVKPYLDSCNLAVGIPYPGSRWWTHPHESGIDILDYNYDNQWIVGFSARDEILVRPHGATVDEMFQIKREMFDFLVSEGWAKQEWQEDVRIRRQQDEAVANGTLTAASGLTYAGH